MANPSVAPTPDPTPHLKVSTVDQEPFVYREMTKDGEVYVGFLKELLDEISRRAGFTYDFMQADDSTFGYDKPGGWGGIIGDVQSGKADIGGAALTVTAAREQVVDFSKPFLTDSVNLLVYKPTWFGLGLGNLVRPFSSDYWIMLFVAMVLIGLVFFLIGKFSPYEWGNTAAEKDPRGAYNAFSLRNSYLFVLSTLSWQGFREAPRSLSGRFMAACWWFFVFATLVAYSSNLTAYLLARPEQVIDLPFKNYEDLLNNNDIQVGALNFGSTQAALRTSRSQTLKSLWTKMNKQRSWEESYREATKRVVASEGGFVMMMEASSAEYEARRNCKLMIFGENLFPTSMGFAMKKGSFWKAKFNDALSDIRSEGLLAQLKDKYWRFGGDCNNVDGRKLNSAGFMNTLPIYPITLKDMAVAIILLFLGMIVSIIFLIVEIVHFRVTKKGKKLHRPAIIKNPPKIFKPRGKGAAKPAAAVPADIEAVDEEAGPSSSGQNDLENVPLDDMSAEPQPDAEPAADADAPAPDEEDKLLSDKEKAEA